MMRFLCGASLLVAAPALAQESAQSAAEFTVQVSYANQEAAYKREFCEAFLNEATYQRSQTNDAATLKKIAAKAQAARACIDLADKTIRTWGPRDEQCDGAVATLLSAVQGSPPEREAQAILKKCKKWSADVPAVVRKIGEAFETVRARADVGG